MQPHCALIQTGEIQAVVGDAARDGIGGPQYCGLWSLASIHRPFNAFGNAYAGLLPGEIRGKAPRLEIVNDSTVALTRDADEKYPSHCRATYEVRSPNVILHTLAIRDERSMLVRGTATPFREVSWCSYMNSPEDSRLNFLSGGQWMRYIPPKHGVGSNIAPSYITPEQLEKLPAQHDTPNGYREPFHYDRIRETFDQPFYFGRLGHMMALYVFDQPRWLRFFVSPSGGGSSILPGKSCPAWDFHYLIPEKEYRVGGEYTFRVALVYKLFVSDEDALQTARDTQNTFGFERV